MEKFRHYFAKKRILNTLFMISIVIISGILATLLLFNGSLGRGALPNTGDGGSGEIPENAAPKYTIVLDAGHGGRDGGAVGSFMGVIESTLNLQVANLVKAGFEKQGVKVIMTRSDENAIGETKREDMNERKRIMNTEGVDLIVSVHMNKFRDASVSGPMAFYMQGSVEGEALATYVINSVCAALERPVRLANPGDYFVVREGAVPSVLVECGFLSNREDERLLQEEAHQKKIADGIVTGVMEYFTSRVKSAAEDFA